MMSFVMIRWNDRSRIALVLMLNTSYTIVLGNRQILVDGHVRKLVYPFLLLTCRIRRLFSTHVTYRSVYSTSVLTVKWNNSTMCCQLKCRTICSPSLLANRMIATYPLLPYSATFSISCSTVSYTKRGICLPIFVASWMSNRMWVIFSSWSLFSLYLLLSTD